MSFTNRFRLALALIVVIAVIAVTGSVFILNNEDLNGPEQIVGVLICYLGGLASVFFVDGVVLKPKAKEPKS